MESLSKKTIFVISEGGEKTIFILPHQDSGGTCVGHDLLFSSISDALRNLVPRAGGFAWTPSIPNESKWHFK